MGHFEEITTPLSEPIPADQQLSNIPGIDEVALRFGIDTGHIASYVQPGEQLTSFGNGGSESLVLFVQSPSFGNIVRKVCAEKLASVPWDPDGTGVMSPPSTKGGLQVDYLTRLPEPLRSYFPAVHNVHRRDAELIDGRKKQCFVYDQTLVTGTEISTFVAEAQPSPAVTAHLHREVMRLLAERVHTNRQTPNNEDTLKESYFDKITARLELSREAAPKVFSPIIDADQLVINNTPYRNIAELIAFFDRREIRAMLEPRVHGLVMGDTNTENILITKFEAIEAAMRTQDQPEFTHDDLGITFIDPRAIGYRSVGGDTVDDAMYDNKPIHNSSGHYDVIHNEHFSLALGIKNDIPQIDIREHTNNPYTPSYQGIESYFEYIMDGWGVNTEEFQQADPNWLLRFTFMMGTHFASMPPFHFKKSPGGEVHDDVQMQRRAIAIYCKGIQWLTYAREMITGERHELYNVPVGQIKPSNRD